MTNENPTQTMIRRCAVAAVALLTAASALPVSADEPAAGNNPFRPDHPWIYQTAAGEESDPNVDPPYDYFIQILPENGTDTLRLFITVDGPGDAPNFGTGGGTPCTVGDGGLDSDHICAFTANFAIDGDAEFVSFFPNEALSGIGGLGLASIPDSSDPFPPGQKTFSLSFVDPANPLPPGTFPIGGVVELGHLNVRTSSAFAEVRLVSGEAVRSVTLKEAAMGAGQSLSSLSGDAMEPRTLAVSICDEPLRGPGVTVECGTLP